MRRRDFMVGAVAVAGSAATRVAFAQQPETRHVRITHDVPHVNLRELHDTLYPTAKAGDSIICTVERGVTLGPCFGKAVFEIGEWPEGVEIKLDIQGKIGFSILLEPCTWNSVIAS